MGKLSIVVRSGTSLTPIRFAGKSAPLQGKFTVLLSKTNRSGKKIRARRIFLIFRSKPNTSFHYSFNMKKAIFSFLAVRGSYLHRFLLGKINSRRVRNTIAATTAAICINNASAQCDVFKNADAANPLLAVLPAGKQVVGFAFGDIDSDGDQDVYVDFMGKDEDAFDPLHLYKNIGTKTHPVFKEDSHTGFGKQKTGGQNGEMQFVDIDGDGDLDYFVSDSVSYYYHNTSYVYYYKNVGTPKSPRFIPANQDFLPILATRYIQPFVFADVDGDGDYDLYASDAGFYLPFAYNQRVYFNTGTPQHPVFNDKPPVPSSSEDAALYRTYYDWNKDGLLDYFSVDYLFDYSVYYKNIGPKDNPQYVYNAAGHPDFRKALPYRMIDLNNDGAPEVFDFNAHYSILTPIAVIKDSVLQNGNTALFSENKNAAYTYRWEYNGSTIAGATRYYIVPKQPGTYTLYITGTCGTGVSLNYEFTKTNLQPLIADSKTANLTSVDRIAVAAYPNPFVSSISLQLPGTACTVKITDMSGRVLVTQTTSATTTRLGEHLKAGIYIIEVWQNKQSVYSTTIVKQ